MNSFGFELDHVVIFVSPDAPEAKALETYAELWAQGPSRGVAAA